MGTSSSRHSQLIITNQEVHSVVRGKSDIIFDIVIPAAVTIIRSDAFVHYNRLNSVVLLLDTLTIIGLREFPSGSSTTPPHNAPPYHVSPHHTTSNTRQPNNINTPHKIPNMKGVVGDQMVSHLRYVRACDGALKRGALRRGYD